VDSKNGGRLKAGVYSIVFHGSSEKTIVPVQSVKKSGELPVCELVPNRIRMGRRQRGILALGGSGVDRSRTFDPDERARGSDVDAAARRAIAGTSPEEPDQGARRSGLSRGNACEYDDRAWTSRIVVPAMLRRRRAAVMSDQEAEIAQKSPYKVELEAGQLQFWCACGKSQNQPYCDGSHKGTGFTPLRVEVEETGTQFLCGCKRTATPPFCDGTHRKL
jgi:CDGSH-type Zn-finger protein